MAIILTDPFLFGMYSVEAFLDFELLVFFLLRWKPQKTRHVAVLGLAYLCFGIARLLLMFWDYENPADPVGTARYYITAAFFAFLAMAVFLHAAETLIVKTRHVATICFIGLAIAILFFPNEMYTNVQMIYYVFAPISIIFVISFLFYLMSMTSGRVRKKFFVVFMGLALYGTGYALSADIFHFSKIVSVSIVLVGLAMTALGFIEIPQLEEIHWHDYLLHVFTFHIDTSACIHDETLGKAEKEDGMSADLFSSGVTGVIGIIKEMIQSEKKLKVLDHEDKKILLEYGKHVTVALITRKDLDILHEKLRLYIRRVETDLQQQLERWRGEVSRFGPQMKTITTEIFKTVIDKNWWKVDPRSVARQVKDFFKGLIPSDILAPRAKKEDGESNQKGTGTLAVEATQPAIKQSQAATEPETDPWPAPDPSKAKPSRVEPRASPTKLAEPTPDAIPALQPAPASKPEAKPAMPAWDGSAKIPAEETRETPRNDATGTLPASPPAVEKPAKPAKKAPAKPRATKPAPVDTSASASGPKPGPSVPETETKTSKPAAKPAAGKKKK